MKRVSPVLLAILLMMTTGMLAAQVMPEQQQAQQEREAEEERIFGDLRESDVEAFARVHYQVRELEREFANDLRNRGEGDDPAEMQEAMSEERIRLIEEAGLDSETYRQILGAMARNEALREHVAELEEEHRAEN